MATLISSHFPISTLRNPISMVGGDGTEDQCSAFTESLPLRQLVCQFMHGFRFRILILWLLPAVVSLYTVE
jgi:hypothetical protein